MQRFKHQLEYTPCPEPSTPSLVRTSAPPGWALCANTRRSLVSTPPRTPRDPPPRSPDLPQWFDGLLPWSTGTPWPLPAKAPVPPVPHPGQPRTPIFLHPYATPKTLPPSNPRKEALDTPDVAHGGPRQPISPRKTKHGGHVSGSILCRYPGIDSAAGWWVCAGLLVPVGPTCLRACCYFRAWPISGLPIWERRGQYGWGRGTRGGGLLDGSSRKHK